MEIFSLFLDALITTSIDGLAKVWDLRAQCCVQTIASHRGKLWTSDFSARSFVSAEEDDSNGERARLVTGDDQGPPKVWSISLGQNLGKVYSSGGGSEQVATVDDKEHDYCEYMGTLNLPSSVPPPGDHVSCIRFHPNGRYVGVLHASSRSVFIYRMRSAKETQRRKHRRLSRRRQKSKQAESIRSDDTAATRKRGILDDAEPAVEDSSPTSDVDKLEASDEFEFLGIVNASHRVQSFAFVPWKEGRSTVRIVCSLATNAIEVIGLQRPETQ